MSLFRLLRLFALSTALSAAATVAAAPHIPASDATVLERLPFKPNDPVARDMAQLRQALRRDPNNVEIAVRLARRYYDQVGEEGDPRYLGYAQAALGPWWNMAAPPVEVQVMRAALRQFQHDFDGALADLDGVLSRVPGHARARALRATIHLVQARYEQAAADCRALRGGDNGLIATACEQMVAGLTGHAEAAYRTLSAALAAAGTPEASQRLWVEIRLAELAQRLGRHDEAEAHFKRGLALGITDTFLLAAYADFLLDRDRPSEVVSLLQDKTRSDVLLLRLVLAQHRLGRRDTATTTDALAARYAAAQLRGDTVHQQEEARFELEIRKQPKRALALAAENWKVQREPRDARVFLEAAVAAGDPAAARPVLDWLAASGIEDRHLQDLGRRLREVRK